MDESVRDDLPRDFAVSVGSRRVADWAASQ